MKIALHLDAGHDVKGNPRRVYVVLNEKADIVDVIDEGYEGVSALHKSHGKIPVTGRLSTSASERRELLRFSAEAKMASGKVPRRRSR